MKPTSKISYLAPPTRMAAAFSEHAPSNAPSRSTPTGPISLQPRPPYSYIKPTNSSSHHPRPPPPSHDHRVSLPHLHPEHRPNRTCSHKHRPTAVPTKTGQPTTYSSRPSTTSRRTNDHRPSYKPPTLSCPPSPTNPLSAYSTLPSTRPPNIGFQQRFTPSCTGPHNQNPSVVPLRATARPTHPTLFRLRPYTLPAHRHQQFPRLPTQQNPDSRAPTQNIAPI